MQIVNITVKETTNIQNDVNFMLCSGFHKIPKFPTAIRDIVMSYAQNVRMEVTNELQSMKASTKFSLTCDEWTSIRNRRFINVNIHDGGPTFGNLGLIRAKESLTAEVILENLRNKLMEFHLNLDHDISAITTDGAAVMKKLGRLVNFQTEQQLCFAHGINLAVVDVLYQKPKEVEPEDIHDSDEDDDSEEENDDGFELNVAGEKCKILHTTLGPVIETFRNVVRKCKRSAKLNDMLQKYVKQDLGHEFALKLDCKTRWSSMLTMLESVVKVKTALQKVWIDTQGTDWGKIPNEEDFMLVENVIKALTPVRNTVEAICCANSTLITADAAMDFMLKVLSSQDSEIAIDILDALKNRLQERRTKNSSILQYLHTGNLDYNNMSSTFNSFFPRPTQSQIIETVKKFNHLGQEENDDRREDAPEMEVDLCQDLKKQLHEAIKIANDGGHCPANTPQDAKSLTGIIRKEISLWETTGNRGILLQNAFNSLLSIKPTSVEAERAFSSAGYLCSKIRSRMSDETLDTLCFLRAFFRK